MTDTTTTKTNREYRRFTPAEDDVLREMVRDGETDAAIAGELGRTVRSVASRRRVLRRRAVRPRGDGRPGVERLNDARLLKKRMAGPPVDVDRRLVVINLLRRGWTVNRMARYLGCGSSPLCRLLRRMERDGLVRSTRAVVYVTRWEAVDDERDADADLSRVANPNMRGGPGRPKKRANEGERHGDAH